MKLQRSRTIGSYGQGKPGPLLFLIGGIHGNEPAGVIALERVFEKLAAYQPEIQGKILGLCGNCAALASEQRYIDHDLNRLWSEPIIERIKATPPQDRNSEEREILELLRFFEAAFKSEYQPQIFVDLHTTSATGGPFSIVTDDPQNVALAKALEAPIIFNLVNELALTTNKYFEDKGLIGLAFESGQHDDPVSVDVHEAAIWVMLVETGCIKAAAIPHFERYPDALKAASDRLDRFLSVSYRHDIRPQDGFRMRPGYENFQTVRSGEILASDQGGEIACPLDGQILMPLYQNQGEDGFFVIKAIPQAPL